MSEYFVFRRVSMRVSLVNVLIIAATLLVALIVSLLAVQFARWRRDLALRRHGAPKLVVPIADNESGVLPPPAFRELHLPSQIIAPMRSIEAAPEIVELVDRADTGTEGTRALTRRKTEPLQLVTSSAAQESARPADGRVKFLERSDGTLQFLPGRLEILSGPDLGQEVHFARPLGEETASITFGRSEGNPLRHVQLLDPTVSRAHARLDFSGGRWRLTNLSSTNPVVLNGRAIDEREVSVLLGDGDRIEMGAVVFVFRER